MIAWFVRNRVAANLLLFGISLGGLLTIRGVPQELLPETRSAILAVRTDYPGADAAVVEDTVLRNLEGVLRDVSGIGEMTGLAAEGTAILTLEVEHWADRRSVGDEVRERIESLTSLPADAEDPVLSELSIDRPLLRIAVHGEADERSLHEAGHLVADAVGQVPGVANAEIASGRETEIAIEIPEAVLSRFGLTFDQVARAIRRGSADIPGGAVRSEAGDVRVSTEAKAATAAGFARIPLIATPEGGVVRVGDVASVTDGFEDREVTATMNGEAAVFLEVTLASGARLLDTAGAVHARVREVEATLPPGVAVTTWSDTWQLFESRMELLVRNGLEGLALVFLVLFFTLSSRLAVWTAAGLPVAFFGAFLLMPGLGVTVNMFALFGFIVTLGILVDDAIVVGENVERHIAENPARVEEATVRGVRQVLFPASFGVLTTMAAFAPLLGLPGLAGEIIGTLPRIVIPVLAFSLLDAAWILPRHLAHGGLGVRPSVRLARVRAAVRNGLDRMVRRYYRPALAWSLRNRAATVALGALWLSLALGAVGGGWVPVESTSPFDGDVVTLQVSLPPGSPATATAEAVREVEAAIDGVREEILARAGVDPQRHLAVLVGQRLPFGPGDTAGDALADRGSAVGQINLELIPPEERAGFTVREIADRVRERTRSLPHGAQVTVLTSLAGDQADISVRVSGAETADLLAGAAALRSVLGEYAGVLAVTDDLEGSAPELVARTRSGGAGLGISAGEFGRQLRQALHGEEVQRIQRGREELRVLLRLPRAERATPETVTGMRVRRTDGGTAPLAGVAELSREEKLSVIPRVDGNRAVTVFASVDPEVASAGAVTGDLRTGALPSLRERFPNLRFEMAGRAGETDETLAVLRRNALLGLILIYGLLAVPLSSWTQPFVIMAAIPFGLAGAVFGHVLTGTDLTLNSFFGMVALIGIVVNDALVLLDFANSEKRRGLTAGEAALAAGALRFRPVVLTSVTTCAGLFPLLAERSLQAQFLMPMAVSLAFGVAFATLVTLFLVPSLYSLADGACRAVGRR